MRVGGGKETGGREKRGRGEGRGKGRAKAWLKWVLKE